MDGINLLRETRAGGFSGLFIIITGKHRAHVAIDALNNGADYYVQKGGGIVNDMEALVDFIRGRVSEKSGQTGHCLRVRVCIVQLLKTIPIFFAVFSRREKFVLEMIHLRILSGTGRTGSIGNNFILLLPEDEREKIVGQLHNLSPSNPEILIEHAIKKVMDHPPRSNGIIVRFSILMGILLSIKQQGGKFPDWYRFMKPRLQKV